MLKLTTLNSDVVLHMLCNDAEVISDNEVGAISDQEVICCGGDISNTFFSYDCHMIGGSTYLVTRAITETPLLVSQMLHPRDINYHMMVGKFISHLTRSQWQDFAKIINKTVELSTSATAYSSKYLLPSLPVTQKFIDGVYIRGKYSLFENLPRLNVSVVDNHGYVSLQDCLYTCCPSVTAILLSLIAAMRLVIW
jgi:hypothetical protein